MRRLTPCLLVVLALGMAREAFAGAAVEVYALAPGAEPDPAARAAWPKAALGAPLPGGAALENKHLLVLARVGSPGAAVYAKPGGAGAAPARRLELAWRGTQNAAGALLERVAVARSDGAEAALRIRCGGLEAELVLGAGRVYVAVLPPPGAGVLTVQAAARYALLPDFFADDIVFDPRRFKVPKLTVPAENFLFLFPEGGQTLLTCIWATHLRTSGSGPAAGPAPGPSGPSGDARPAGPAQGGAGERPAAGGPAPGGEADQDPRVELHFEGAGDGRKVVAAEIECTGRPLYVGVLEQAGLWHAEDVRALPGYLPQVSTWKRPFEAKWRGDFLAQEGKFSTDWRSRNQSYEFKGPVRLDEKQKPVDKWWGQGTEESPTVWQESLVTHLIYPCWFKAEETRFCLYAEKAERDRIKGLVEAERKAAEKAKKEGQAHPPAPAPVATHIYETVLIYPVERKAETPLTVFTPVDVMRETLGQGPCEYVLDVEGVKPRPTGGDRPILSYATCGLWMEHIFPILSRMSKDKEGKLGVKQKNGKSGRLDEKTEKHLIQALEDMWHFVKAVHDRLREYKKFGEEVQSFCAAELQRAPQIKPLAEKVLLLVKALNGDVGRLRFEGPGTEGFWKERIPQLIEQVKEGRYEEVGQIGGIRNLGNQQDEMVSRCRQYVRGMRQEASLVDASEPELRHFALAIREKTQQMLRKKHEKEGL